MDITELEDVYVLDYGENGATISHNGEVATKVKPKDVLDLPKVLPKGSLLITEYAHMGCARKDLSLSQPFDAGQLISFYANCAANNITLKLFPQQSTPRACDHAFNKGLFPDIKKREDIKNDIRDPVSIYNLILDFPEISLMNPPVGDNLLTVNPKIQEAWDFKDKTNIILNYARKFGSEIHEEHETGYFLPTAKYRIPNDKLIDFIVSNIDRIYDELDDTARNVFGLKLAKSKRYPFGKIKLTTVGRSGANKGVHTSWDINICQIYSTLITLMDHEGNYRYRESTGDFAGWAFIKRFIFCMTPFHFRGGVARSSLYHHGMKNWIHDMSKENDKIIMKKRGKTGKMTSFVRRADFNEEQLLCFKKYRKKYCSAIRSLWQISKKIMIEQRSGQKPQIKKQIVLRPKQKELQFN